MPALGRDISLQYRVARKQAFWQRGGGVVYRFGDFTLDHDIRQLFLSKTEVHLSPKAFELLTVLLANRSRAVSKAELQQHLWPSTFVEETNLASLVAEIRRALRDSASSPAFVRNVYGFGYRFVGEVTVDTATTRSGTGTPGVKLCVVLAKREIVLMEGANVIGREPDATIQIDSRGVSRQHARVLVSHGDATLEDLGSKNGTRVNGRLITTPARLSDGDEIGLGTISLTFRIVSLTSPTETVPTGGA
jgi:DNA-binding winged helix-turn-helix (wHTH) protein